MDWFERNKPSIVIIAAAKVEGFLLTLNNPPIYFKNLKFKQILLSLHGEVELKDYYF